MNEKPEIFNTDQGSQFTSEAFTGRLKKERIDISMDGKGRWIEVFNSDAYDSCNANGVSVNPLVAGNAGGLNADGPPLHGLPASARVVIPANGLVIFAKV
jgi:1,4-alpha-glucan branching enzyme